MVNSFISLYCCQKPCSQAPISLNHQSLLQFIKALNDDFSVCPTLPLQKFILDMDGGMEYYLAILIATCTRAPQLVVYQKNDNFSKQPITTSGLVKL